VTRQKIELIILKNR